MKPDPEDKTWKWCRGQIISKLSEHLYLVYVNACIWLMSMEKAIKGIQNSYVVHQNYQMQLLKIQQKRH